MTENRKFRAGIIGCGNIAGGFEGDPTWPVKPCTHAGCMSCLDRLDLVSACDTSSDRLKIFCRQWGIRRPFHHLAPFVSQDPLDIIAVCTPANTHFEVVKSVLKNRPRLIFCEKPMALSKAQAQAMIELCRAAGVLLMVNHTRRWHPAVQTGKNLIRQGAIGRPLSVVCRYTSGLEVIGTHLLDMALYLVDCGPVRSVSAIREQTTKETLWYSENFNPGDPATSALINFGKSVTMHLLGSCEKEYPHYDVEIDGTLGQLLVLNECRSLIMGEMKPDPELGGAIRIMKREIPIKRSESEMMFAYREIIDILSGERTDSSCDGQDALPVISLVERIRTVSLSQKNEQ